MLLMSTGASVKQALNYRKIKIVNYDWLEDSLLDRSPKRPKDYLLRREVKALAKAKAKRRRVRKENLKQGGIIVSSAEGVIEIDFDFSREIPKRLRRIQGEDAHW